MEIALVPCFRDNYSYLLWQKGERSAVVVDPGEAGPVLRALSDRDLTLAAVLATHHHSDHVGGVSDLVRRLGRLRVFAHRLDQSPMPEVTDVLEDDQIFEVAGLKFRAIHVPGHTRGAVTYLAGADAFTGDTLFVAGCGRVFEGTLEQMFASLHQRLATLPSATRIYCGHEYTENNLRFALHVDPDHTSTREQAARISELRSRGEPSVPSTIGEELVTNPFLRSYTPQELERLGAQLGAEPRPFEVFAALRARKDRW